MLAKPPLPLPKKYDFYIGIDPGVNTAMALWDAKEKKLILLDKDSILRVMDGVKEMLKVNGDKVFIRIEDARKRTWFGNAGREQLQGAGSIKRDCQIWEEFLKEMKANFEFVAPKNNKTKLDARRFEQITKWNKQTNEHTRDAAMLVYGI